MTMSHQTTTNQTDAVTALLASAAPHWDEFDAEAARAVLAALPRGQDLSEYEWMNYQGEDVLVAPGWVAHVYPGPEIDYPDAADGAEAASDYVGSGDWGARDATDWVHVAVWRRGFDRDGDELQLDREDRTIELPADEPACVRGHEHDWQSPYEIVGGLRENPGVQGHGGGVIYREICAHCGRYRTTDTWAPDPDGGEQGKRQVRYGAPDEASLAWATGDADADAD
jgi:hypothetical protein